MAARYKKRGGTSGHHGKRTKYVLSGILVCGECGAPMVVTRGSSALYYKCGDAKNRRTCPNTLGLKEELARECILGELEQRFTFPEAIDYLRKGIAKHVKELGRTHGAELREHEARLARTEQRIGALVAFIANGEDSDYVRVSLRDLEAQAQQEKAAIAALRASAEKPIVLPSPDQVLRTGRRLSEVLHGDAMKAQAALRRLFGGKPIVMRPQTDRTYIAEGEYFPLLALMEDFPDKTRTPRSEGTGAWHTGSCAGRI